ncbi:MAG: futalosine hydrolase [Saprospiraceae bacterium]|nr:futalosine hydrolase [Saprospiraceae bacterium]
MRILLLAATPFEIAPTTNWLLEGFQKSDSGVFTKEKLEILPLISGVGMVATTWSLGSILYRNRPDLVINAGIAGALDPSLQLGDVIFVGSERFADLGVEEADGRFTDLYEMDMMGHLPDWCQKGLLIHPDADKTSFLPVKNGITVNKVHGTQASIDQIRLKYPDAQVESMEGAAVFYACLSSGTPFIELRSISNEVAPRNREAWNLPLAIESLNRVLMEMLQSFQ